MQILDQKFGTSFHDAVVALDTSWDVTGVAPLHVQYILETNLRGREVIDKMEQYFTGPLQGKRVLDIGSGHGGASLAAARAGSYVLAIEYCEGECELSRLNFADHGVQVDLREVDATDVEAMRSLGQFDLVICDNVIEHVDDAQSLLFNIGRAMTDEGRCYVTGPNSRSLGQVLCDCHNREFGLSLLDRFDAQEQYLERGHVGRYSVGDYFDYSQYTTMFSVNGINVVNIVPVDVDFDPVHRASELADKIREKLLNLQSGSHISAKIRDVVSHYLKTFEKRRAELQLSHLQEPSWIRTDFIRNYLQERWDFIGSVRRY